MRTFLGENVDIELDTRLDDVGVNSLAAVELSLLLNERFQSQLPTWVISEHPTPRALFSQLENPTVGVAQAEFADEREAQQTSVQAPQPNRDETRPLRILFLHGEGSDADLMEMSLQATSWMGQLDHLIEFVFLNAPNTN